MQAYANHLVPFYLDPAAHPVWFVLRFVAMRCGRKTPCMVSVKTYPRLVRPPGQSFFFLGVRGVGKQGYPIVRDGR